MIKKTIEKLSGFQVADFWHITLDGKYPLCVQTEADKRFWDGYEVKLSDSEIPEDGFVCGICFVLQGKEKRKNEVSIE